MAKSKIPYESLSISDKIEAKERKFSAFSVIYPPKESNLRTA